MRGVRDFEPAAQRYECCGLTRTVVFAAGVRCGVPGEKVAEHVAGARHSTKKRRFSKALSDHCAVPKVPALVVEQFVLGATAVAGVLLTIS